MPSMPVRVSAQGMVVVTLQTLLQDLDMLRGIVIKLVTPHIIYQTVGVGVEVTLRDHKAEVPLELVAPSLPKVFTKNLHTVSPVSKVPIFSLAPLQMPFSKVTDFQAP